MAKKKKKITKAAASDPTSGRVRTVDNNDFLGRWTSVGGVGGGWVATGVLMARSRGSDGPGGAGPPAPPGWELALVVLGVGHDLVDVGLVDEGRAGQHRATAAEVVAV